VHFGQSSSDMLMRALSSRQSVLMATCSSIAILVSCMHKCSEARGQRLLADWILLPKMGRHDCSYSADSLAHHDWEANSLVGLILSVF